MWNNSQENLPRNCENVVPKKKVQSFSRPSAQSAWSGANEYIFEIIENMTIKFYSRFLC